MTLAVEHVSVSFPGAGGPVAALRDVSLTIADDELVVGVGASGCGKSTLLAAIAGFIVPESGRITDEGREVTGPDATRGVVFQKDTLLPWANARDNVAFGLRLAGLDRRTRAARADALLARVGLAGLGDRMVWTLSGGMRQRVGLARAIATAPRLLLLDEPLGALDSFTREAMQELIARLWATECRRMFFITHDIEEALFLGTTILVFSPLPGRIVARIEADHVRRLLAGGAAAAIKADAGFQRQRLEIRDLIHAQGAPSTPAPRGAPDR